MTNPTLSHTTLRPEPQTSSVISLNPTTLLSYPRIQAIFLQERTNYVRANQPTISIQHLSHQSHHPAYTPNHTILLRCQWAPRLRHRVFPHGSRRRHSGERHPKHR